MKKRYLIYALLLLVIIAVLFGLYLRSKDTEQVPEGYIELTSYVHPQPGQLQCAAMLPGCGICEEEPVGGTLIKDKCYVPKDSSWVQ